MREYVDLFKETKEENNQLISLLEENEMKNQMAEENLNVLNQRVLGDSMVINQLNDELQRYKEMYHNMKEENNINSLLSVNVLGESSSRKNNMFRSGMSMNK